MATYNQDIKTLFPLYDCQPNQRRFEKFYNDLLAKAGEANADTRAGHVERLTHLGPGGLIQYPQPGAPERAPPHSPHIAACVVYGR